MEDTIPVVSSETFDFTDFAVPARNEPYYAAGPDGVIHFGDSPVRAIAKARITTEH